MDDQMRKTLERIAATPAGRHMRRYRQLQEAGASQAELDEVREAMLEALESCAEAARRKHETRGVRGG